MSKKKSTGKKVQFKVRDNCAKKRMRRLVKYLRSELKISTTHGLPYIVNDQLHWFERFVWSMILLVSIVVIGVLLLALYRRFVTAPTVMSVEMDYFNWNISYPAIYLCPLDKADYNLMSNFIKRIQIIQNDTDKDFDQYIESIVTATMESVHLIQVPDKDTIHHINPREYGRIAAKTYKKMSSSSLSSVGPWPVRYDVTMTELGMCDVINSNIAAFDNPIKWSDTSTFISNNVELSFHDRDFFVQLMNYSESYKIYVQSPNDVILIGSPASTFDDDGFLKFGVHISSIKASSDLRNLPISLRKCRFVDEPLTGRYPVYSYNRCLMECRIRMIVRLCNCVPHFYKPLKHEKVCNLAELKCVDRYRKDIFSITTSNVTRKMFSNSKDLPRHPRECACLDNCEYTSYQKDEEVFLPQEWMNKVRVNIASYPKVRITREILFGYYDMFLRAGGIINLVIGASVISIMELILTILRIPIYGLMQIPQFLSNRRNLIKDWIEYKKK